MASLLQASASTMRLTIRLSVLFWRQFASEAAVAVVATVRTTVATIVCAIDLAAEQTYVWFVQTSVSRTCVCRLERFYFLQKIKLIKYFHSKRAATIRGAIKMANKKNVFHESNRYELYQQQ